MSKQKIMSVLVMSWILFSCTHEKNEVLLREVEEIIKYNADSAEILLANVGNLHRLSEESYMKYLLLKAEVYDKKILQEKKMN